MPVRKLKPTTPGQRHKILSAFTEITESKPEKSLLAPKSKSGGRNNQGRMTMRYIGGGHKKRYRIIDFKRDKDGVPARVAAVEYDPNRTCFICLLHYADGEKRYILAPIGVGVGDTLVSGPDAEPTAGNAKMLRDIPIGLQVHNIELQPGRGGQLVRSAGTTAQLTAREGNYAVITLPSGELRRVHVTCRATIGRVGNTDHQNVKLGKAGRKRHLGRRPHVRGTAMNPVDHNIGGGEGRAKGGKPPRTPWGKMARGLRTSSSKSRNTKKFVATPRRRGPQSGGKRGWPAH